ITFWRLERRNTQRITGARSPDPNVTGIGELRVVSQGVVGRSNPVAALGLPILLGIWKFDGNQTTAGPDQIPVDVRDGAGFDQGVVNQPRSFEWSTVLARGAELRLKHGMLGVAGFQAAHRQLEVIGSLPALAIV